MTGRKPTMDDVAAMAHVSRITVDRVLNRRGMVSARTEERVLAAARALNLDRSMDIVPTRILRIGIVLQNNTNHYYVKLRQTYARAIQQYAKFNIRISWHYFEKLDAEAVNRTLDEAERVSDALIVVLFEDPAVVRKVRDISRRMSVVTLASDLPHSGRLRYVGSDAILEGRTAGGLIGQFLGDQGGDVVIIQGMTQLHEHAQREAGFRTTLRLHYTNCNIVDCYQSFEVDDGGKIISRMLERFPNLRAIYNMSVGNPSIVQVLKKAHRAEKTVIIAHTLTPETQDLLEAGYIRAVIDRDIDLDVRRTLEIILHAEGRLESNEISPPQMPQILIRENAHPR
jgi:LacI family transcriptional regulator